MFLQKDSPHFDHPAPWGHSLKDLAAMQETLYSTEHLNHMSVPEWVGQWFSVSVGHVGGCAVSAKLHCVTVDLLKLVLSSSSLHTVNYIRTLCESAVLRTVPCVCWPNLTRVPTNTYVRTQAVYHTRHYACIDLILSIKLMASNTLHCATFSCEMRRCWQPHSVQGCGVDVCNMSVPVCGVWCTVGVGCYILCDGLWTIPQVHAMLQGLMHHIALQQRVTLNRVLSSHMQD